MVSLSLAKVRRGFVPFFAFVAAVFLHFKPLKQPETNGTAAACAADLSKVRAVTAALLFRVRGRWRASTYRALTSLKAAPPCARPLQPQEHGFDGLPIELAVVD